MGASYILVQEAHGNEELCSNSLGLLGVHYHAYTSFLPGHAGGLLTLISKKSVPDSSCINYVPYARGRVARTVVLGPASQHIIWNVHNHDVSDVEWDRINRQLTSDIILCVRAYSALSQGEDFEDWLRGERDETPNICRRINKSALN